MTALFLSCSIAEDFELIAAAFANQSVGIVFTTPDIAFVAENVSKYNIIRHVFMNLFLLSIRSDHW